MVIGALAVGAQAFSSTPTTTTGGLPPCGTIDDNGLNCQGLKSKSEGNCWEYYQNYDATYWGAGDYYDDDGGPCDCTTFCCSDDDAVFENGECDTTLSGR